VTERRTLEDELRGYQQQIDAALSPEFGSARKISRRVDREAREHPAGRRHLQTPSSHTQETR